MTLEAREPVRIQTALAWRADSMRSCLSIGLTGTAKDLSSQSKDLRALSGNQSERGNLPNRLAL